MYLDQSYHVCGLADHCVREAVVEMDITTQIAEIQKEQIVLVRVHLNRVDIQIACVLDVGGILSHNRMQVGICIRRKGVGQYYVEFGLIDMAVNGVTLTVC